MTAPWPPVVGICGWKDAGKTALIEALIPRLTERGLTVGVIKHDVHGLEVDREGKDTDRYFRAGAEVLAHDEEQVFTRRRLAAPVDLDELVWRLGERCEVVLVEGHKDSPVPKLWLAGVDGGGAPPEADHVIAVLHRSGKMEAEALELILDLVEESHRRLTVFAGVLIGGASTRMGRPKALLPWHGETLLEHTVRTLEGWVERVVLLGTGPTPEPLREMPRLADAPGLEGPMAGVLAALRWAPRVRWLVLPCDLPHLSNEALDWLLGEARPGLCAVLPHLPHSHLPEPLFALYDPPTRLHLERAAAAGRFSLRRALPADECATPAVPESLAPAWRGVNTPEEWHRLLDEGT